MSSESVVKEFRRCRKPTDFYRLQIALENGLCPQEISDLVRQRHLLPAPGRDWLDRLSAMMFGEITDVRHYRARVLCPNVWVFGGAPDGAAEDARRPHLLVAFCGYAHRLMLPICVALQHFDHTQFDVAVLADPSRRMFLSGIEGYAEDFDGILARLAADVDLGAYETVRCLGTSSGAVMALRAGAQLGAERAVSIGGRPIRSFTRLGDMIDEVAGRFDDAFARARNAGVTRFVCAYSDGQEEDRVGGQALATELNGIAVGVPGIDDHDLNFEVVTRARLGYFFDALLLSDTPADAALI